MAEGRRAVQGVGALAVTKERRPRIPPNVASIRFDLIIIGAGINGAGIARDAALRGLRVLLLDKDDIGGATSAWNTRLIHGGLRYLEYAEISLVRESLRERKTLLRIAPHLVRPLQLMVPIYRRSTRGPWTIRAGMFLYDLLSAGAAIGRHRMLPPEEAAALAPGLGRQGLLGAALYHDAQVEFAERLVLENALDAAFRGAVVITHAPATRIVVENGAATGVEFTDRLTGTSHSARAPVVINAAGPWADDLLGTLGATAPERMVGGTRGSHIVVGPFSGAPRVALYSEARTDARPYFIVPWNGQYLIGTTDIRHDADPGEARAGGAEIDYLLSETNSLIPSARLGRGDILLTYSGVRPLPYEPDKRPADVTRRHIIHDHGADPSPIRGLLSVIGGKLTTYRSLAEEVVTRVFALLGRDDPGCTTAAIPLPGARANPLDRYCREFRHEFALPPEVCERLLRIYGSRAGLIGQLVERNPSLGARLPGATPVLAAEVVHAIKQEHAATLTDVLARRMLLALSPDRGLPALAPAAAVAQEIWPREKVEEDAREYERFVRETTGVPGPPTPP